MMDARSSAILDVARELGQTRNMTYESNLGSGAFGDVIKVYDPSLKKSRAAKVISREFTKENETRIWPQLTHPNILPMEEAITSTNGSTIIFMPLQFKSMQDIVLDKKFCESHKSFLFLKRWFLQVLNGVEYLHSSGICHLDLKLDNVLLAHDGTALISDFSFISSTKRLLTGADVGLPLIYKAPEVYDGEYGIQGTAFDMWSYGVLVVEALTGLSILKHINIAEQYENCQEMQINSDWKNHIISRILQGKNFWTLIRKAYPASGFSLTDVQASLDFVSGFLRENPNTRVSARKALDHSFLKSPERIWLKMGDIHPSGDSVCCGKLKNNCVLQRDEAKETVRQNPVSHCTCNYDGEEILLRPVETLTTLPLSSPVVKYKGPVVPPAASNLVDNILDVDEDESEGALKEQTLFIAPSDDSCPMLSLRAGIYAQNRLISADSRKQSLTNGRRKIRKWISREFSRVRKGMNRLSRFFKT